MFPMVLGKLLAAGLGLGLIAAVASNASAATSSNMPPALVDAMVNAIASKDPGVMRAVATKLESLGYPLPAGDLRKTADEVEAEASMGRTQSTLMPGTGSAPRVEPVSPGTPASAAQVLAAKLSLNLHTTAPGREDKRLVAQYQTQEALTADGKYGPKTALTFVKYGIVPETPRSWPAGSAGNAARSVYALTLRAQAAKDPTRAEEWEQAARAAETTPRGQSVPKLPLPKAKDYTGDPNALAAKLAAAAGYQQADPFYAPDGGSKSATAAAPPTYYQQTHPNG